MIKASIIGATGFTGSELVRLLVPHPEVTITHITSESREGERFSDVHPAMRGFCEMKLTSIKDIDTNEIDVAFLALPHGVSMDFVKAHYSADFKIIDLSGDFRLDSATTYNEWYPKNHVFEEGFKTAVYGLPETNREKIKSARLVANPGCYPTSAILGIAPLVANGWIEPQIIVDAKSGVTGAGIKPKPNTIFAAVNEDFKAYGVPNHRHTIEIQQQADALYTGGTNIQFTPHLLPIDRGIVSTTYSKPSDNFNANDLANLYKSHYENEPFVRLLEEPPSVKNLRGTNLCDIFCTYNERTNTVISISAIDNLVKGAAGQAVHNMNLMFGLDEKLGLEIAPLRP